MSTSEYGVQDLLQELQRARGTVEVARNSVRLPSELTAQVSRLQGLSHEDEYDQGQVDQILLQFRRVEMELENARAAQRRALQIIDDYSRHLTARAGDESATGGEGGPRPAASYSGAEESAAERSMRRDRRVRRWHDKVLPWLEKILKRLHFTVLALALAGAIGVTGGAAAALPALLGPAVLGASMAVRLARISLGYHLARKESEGDAALRSRVSRRYAKAMLLNFATGTEIGEWVEATHLNVRMGAVALRLYKTYHDEDVRELAPRERVRTVVRELLRSSAEGLRDADDLPGGPSFAAKVTGHFALLVLNHHEVRLMERRLALLSPGTEEHDRDRKRLREAKAERFQAVFGTAGGAVGSLVGADLSGEFADFAEKMATTYLSLTELGDFAAKYWALQRERPGAESSTGAAGDTRGQRPERRAKVIGDMFSSSMAFAMGTVDVATSVVNTAALCAEAFTDGTSGLCGAPGDVEALGETVVQLRELLNGAGFAVARLPGEASWLDHLREFVRVASPEAVQTADVLGAVHDIYESVETVGEFVDPWEIDLEDPPEIVRRAKDRATRALDRCRRTVECGRAAVAYARERAEERWKRIEELLDL